MLSRRFGDYLRCVHDEPWARIGLKLPHGMRDEDALEAVTNREILALS